MDPVALSLLSIFGGVTITVIAGFIGAWIQGRREHDKWLRERRFEAFKNALDLVESIGILERRFKRAIPAKDSSDATIPPSREDLDFLRGELNGLLTRLASAETPVKILGPPEVEAALDRYSASKDENGYARSEDAAILIAAMRKAIKI